MNFQEIKLKASNRLHSFFILLVMTFMLVLVGFVFSGGYGALFATLFVVFAFLFTPRLSPNLILRMYGAQKINPHMAEGLYDMVQVLCHKAGVQQPDLYYLPSLVMNSFTLGDEKKSHIVLSEGLLTRLNSREMFAVLAHEVSHIKNRDLQVMALADVLSRVTAVMSFTGIFLLFFSLPLMLVSDQSIPFLGLLLLMFAPNINALLQLALSRTREFIADQQAVELSGDPYGLAMALEKIEIAEQHWARRLLIPHYKLSEPSLLRTHPSSKERIQRLNKLAEIQHEKQNGQGFPELNPFWSKPTRRKPRHRIHGFWH